SCPQTRAHFSGSCSPEKLDSDFVRPWQYRRVQRLGGRRLPHAVDIDADVAAGANHPLLSLEQTDRLPQIETAARTLELDHIDVDVHGESHITVLDDVHKYIPVLPLVLYVQRPHLHSAYLKAAHKSGTYRN